MSEKEFTEPLLELHEPAAYKTRRNQANCLSQLFFAWVFNTIKIASKITLENDMIEELPPDQTSQSFYERFMLNFEKLKDEKNGLTWALFITSKTECIKVFLIMLIQILAQLCNPILIKVVIDYLYDPIKNTNQGILLICSIVTIRVFTVLCSAHSLSKIRIVGFDWLSIISMALLGKSMNVSFMSNKSHSNGQVLNYMQVDAMKLQWLGWYLSQVLLMPLQITISIYLMFEFIGISFLGGVAVIIMTAAFNIFIGKKMMAYQGLLMKDKDARTKCANEIFQQIKFIKVNAFEEYFRDKLTILRNKEIKTLKTRFFISCLNILSVWLSPMLILNATFAIFVGIGNDLTPSTTFAIISLFQMLQGPLLFLPMALNALIEANISLRRIQSFLKTDEMMNDCVIDYHEETAQNAIEIINGQFYWSKYEEQDKNNENDNKQKQKENQKHQQVVDASIQKQPKTILKDIYLQIPKGQFVALIGDVGSGKSSLLQAILGEMIYKDLVPQVVINGSIAYVSQKAWIQNATVYDNILFGKEFNQEKYDEALYYSCLKDDIKILIKGDQTMIGEKGVNLSGGQKARVTLARAIYSDSDIYLLDDPISAVDVHVGKFIMHECLNGYLKHKTRILVTHALNYCQYTDYVYLMEDGQVVDQGQFDDIKLSARFKQVYQKFYKEVNEEKENEEEITQNSDDPKELVLQKLKSSVVEENKLKLDQKDEIDELMLLEDRTKGNISIETFTQYFKFNGGIIFFGLLLILMFIWIFSYIGSNLWMAHWTQVSQENQDNGLDTSNFYYLAIYSAFSLSYGTLAFVRSWIFVIQSSNSANQLHNKMISCLIYAPLCQFFERVPLGRILNRLTKDQNVLDAELHWTINWMLVQVFLLLANTYLNVITSSYYVVIPIILYFSGAWFLQRMYMAASRELYRLESISKSPILSYFTESIMGISIIRAFNKQSQIMKKHGLNQDINRKIFLEQIATNVWFSLILGLSSFMVNITAIVFCMFYSTKNPAFAGLLMTYASTLDSNISSTVQCIGSMENSMISFERCVAYTKIKPEKGYEAVVAKFQNHEQHQDTITPNWPNQGKIQFLDYSVQYREGLPPALKGLNVTINPREKIGVVGRTGAGKSTITLTILRILEALEGKILIDGLDISTLSLKQLRESITMIMQDATIIDGTIKENIDPLKKRSDEEILNAIQQCCLKELIDSRKGLETHINEGGDNLSAGEKQLICIARAILKKSPIILIDEATANIDIETEHIIQETIQRAFHDCTVITIAHRINTILHCDKILVLDKGQVKEFGETKDLLKQSDSLFYGIYQEALKEQKH